MCRYGKEFVIKSLKPIVKKCIKYSIPDVKKKTFLYLTI